MNFAIQGVLGRMGRAIAEAAIEFPDCTLTGAVEHDAHQGQGSSLESLGVTCDESARSLQVTSSMPAGVAGVIDFSAPESTLRLLQVAAANKLALVIGTTGFTDEQEQQIVETAEVVPIVRSNNMALGVNMLFELTRLAARVLSKNGFQPEMFEIHHKHKKDAPSGTARTLENIILEEYNYQQQELIHGREGITGERPSSELGSMALRGGDVVGDHTVYFLGEGERVVLQHMATSRLIFARGSLTALQFALQAKPGLYSMADVLGLRQ